MKQMRPRFGAALVGLSMAAAAAATATPPPAQPIVPQRPWRVCVGDIPVPPFILAQTDQQGITERLLVDAGRRAGLAVALLRHPHKRCQKEIDSGEVDALFLSAIPANLDAYGFPMRQGALDVSRRATRVTVVWIKRAADEFDWDGRALKGAGPSTLVAVRAGFRLGRVAAQGLGLQVDEAAFNAQQTLRKLQARRVDLVLAIQQEYESLLQLPEHGGLQALSRPLSNVDYYAVVRKNLPADQQAQVEAWWNEIGQLRDSAAYRE